MDNAEPQEQAFPPPHPERNLALPSLSGGQLRTLRLADSPQGYREPYEVLSCDESNLVCIFVRSLQRAIYGEVWDALEVELVEVDGEPTWFRILQDDDERDRRLAVKRMPWDRINRHRRTTREDPLREIAALELLSDPGHANVLRRVEAVDDGETVYLLTPYIDGGELFEWIADAGGAPESVVKPMFRQIVDGMRYCHSKGICHADMSLENCLTDTSHQNAFIIDFGMCVQMPTDAMGRRRLSRADGRQAKPSYRAPETFKQKPYDGVKVDVFAAGAMLFMMLTGIPPFQHATRADPSFRQLVWRGDVQGILRHLQAPLVAEEAANLLKAMMAYDHQQRILPEHVLSHPWMTSPAAG